MADICSPVFRDGTETRTNGPVPDTGRASPPMADDGRFEVIGIAVRLRVGFHERGSFSSHVNFELWHLGRLPTSREHLLYTSCGGRDLTFFKYVSSCFKLHCSWTMC